MSPLVPGDVVTLNSGGPKMTVSDVRTDTVQCTWFDPKPSGANMASDEDRVAWDGPRKENFSAVSLTKFVPPPEPKPPTEPSKAEPAKENGDEEAPHRKRGHAHAKA